MRKAKAPGYRVLVRMSPLEEKAEVVSKAGIVLEFNSQKDLELKQQGMTDGWVMDIGPMAFKESKTPWCKIGDKVTIFKHSGILVDLKDEYTYRMVQDLDIQVVYQEEGIEL